MSRNPPHKWVLKFRRNAKRKFDSLAGSNKRAIFRHLRELLNTDNPYSLSIVEMLEGNEFDRIRKFRAGDYRVFFTLNPDEVTDQKHTYRGTLYLLDIRDRKEGYQPERCPP
jgi:mRNA-degrading endonuclease RelE of RelBE toxin-antitoxin system